MSKLLAIEWDSEEIRVVAGNATGKRPTISHAFAIPLTGDSSATANEPAAGRNLTAVLTAAMNQHKLARGEVLVAVPRGKAEVRPMRLPPTPDDELPDLVRFQAMRQFSSLSDEWPLDFVKIRGGANEPVSVLAAAISSETMADLGRICNSCQLTPSKLILRPFATAAMTALGGFDQGCVLLVELLSAEVNLTVTVDGQVAFLRSVKMPSHHPDEILLGELRRTIAAAQSQDGQIQVEKVVILGGGDVATGLRDQLSQSLAVPVESLDPFDQFSLECDVPQRPERFAALLGLLAGESAATVSVVDFLHPRRRPEPPNRRVKYAVYAALAASILIVGAGLVWRQLKHYDHQLSLLQAESSALDTQVDIANKLKAEVEEIDAFVRGDVNWLDELHELSRKFPPSEQAIIQQATFNSAADGGGQIVLDGYASDPDVIQRLESGLRDESHRVMGAGARYDERQREYPWAFQERVTVLPKDIDDLVGHSDDAIDDASETAEATDELASDEQGAGR